MTSTPGIRGVYGLCVGLAALALASTASAQPAAPKPPPTAGHMSGVWERYQQRPGGPAADGPPAGVEVPGRILTPPFKPEVRAAYDIAQKASREADLRGEPVEINTVHCLPEGMPAMMNGINPMEILETPGQVTIIQESENQVRRIYLGEDQGVVGDVEPVWFGHAVGHWEGNTLVVDTIGVKEAAHFRQGAEAPVPHSEAMRISERFHMVAPGFLRDDVSITDPAYLTGPWTFSYLYKRNVGGKIREYVCENNHAYVDDKGLTHVDFGGAKKPAGK